MSTPKRSTATAPTVHVCEFCELELDAQDLEDAKWSEGLPHHADYCPGDDAAAAERTHFMGMGA